MFCWAGVVSLQIVLIQGIVIKGNNICIGLHISDMDSQILGEIGNKNIGRDVNMKTNCAL